MISLSKFKKTKSASYPFSILPFLTPKILPGLPDIILDSLFKSILPLLTRLVYATENAVSIPDKPGEPLALSSSVCGA